MGAFTHPVLPACGGSSGGQLSVNIRRKSTPPPRLHHWKSWYALYSPSCELSIIDSGAPCTDLTEAPERMLREREPAAETASARNEAWFLPHAAAAETGRQKPLVGERRHLTETTRFTTPAGSCP
ncbi:hypothetical protein GWK47_044653 [Chionoecetes opilio]|uniref:Uncharacterized protein n=1 Tax=Chionoecetes opilio TaxID=41210 RepID=A0A8J5CYX4_CHIOP|nr:hypothetical protein GWK47_044653 [Chionoecetes opilio]